MTIPYVRKSRGTNEIENYFAILTNGVESSRTHHSLAPLEVQEVTGYSPYAEYGTIVPGTNLDPYANFLSSNRSRFTAEMARRGFPDLPPDRGHPFNNRKYAYLSPTITGNYRRTSTTWHRVSNARLGFRHATLPKLFNMGWTLGSDIADPDLSAFAQRALVDARPSFAEFSLSTFLGEIREGLPKLLPAAFLKDKGSFFKGVGSDYLNVQFGWKPFLSSLQELGIALYQAQHKLNAIQGSPIRRHITGPRTQDYRQLDGVLLSASNGPIVDSALWKKVSNASHTSSPVSDTLGTGTALQTIDSSMTFVGSFVTLLPEQFDDRKYLDRLNQLIDVEITPSVLWALSPWSWLVDWFLDIQGAIDANLLAGDENLLIHYAYASHKTIMRELVWGDATITGWSGPKRLSYVAEQTTYKRIRANPYGFTVGSFGGLSNPQLAILAALGLSRGR